MSFKYGVSLCVAVCVLNAPMVSSGEGRDAFQVEKLSENLYILSHQAYGTNIGLILRDTYLVLIDPMAGPDNHEKLLGEIRKRSDKPIRWIINTHEHEDHTGGNAFFRERGARVWDGTTGTEGSPDSFYEAELHSEVVVCHTLNDRLILLRDEKVLFTGDVFDNSWHPTFYAAGLSGFQRATDRIFALADEGTRIVPGHGRIAQPATVARFRENTYAWVELIRPFHRQGMAVDAIMKRGDVQQMLQRFNTEKKKEWVPERAFRRFIERTLEVLSAEAGQ